MKVHATGWLLLLIYSGSGTVYHLKDYRSEGDCMRSFQEDYAPGIAAEAANARKKGDKCFIKCGQVIAYCVLGERILLPGLLYPTEQD